MNTEAFWKNKKNLKEFEITPEISKKEQEIVKDLEHIFIGIINQVPKNKRIGVLFSGGIDSTLISYLLKKLGYIFTCYTVAFTNSSLETSKDLVSAKKIAKSLDFKLRVIELKINQIPKYIKKITSLIKNPDVVKVGVALAVYPAMLQAQKDKVELIFSGIGSEEIFAGYERHSISKNIKQECLNGLKCLYSRDLQRDFTLAKSTKLQIMAPFLDKELIKYSLRIPAKYKIVKEQKKVILRKAAISLGLKKEFAERKKLAAQYGSKMDKAIEKLAKKEKLSKKEYIQSFISAKAKT